MLRSILFASSWLLVASAWAADNSHTETTNWLNALQNVRQVSLDETTLHQQLPVHSAQARQTRTALWLPLPDGTTTQVTAEPVDILTSDVAAKHPDIQAWRLQSQDGQTFEGQLDYTPQGFHAVLTNAAGETVFIDPQTTDAERRYVSFSKQANAQAFQQQTHCSTAGETTDPVTALRTTDTAARLTAARTGNEIQQYRIAIAATGEYTAYQGGKDAAFAAIVTTVNRLNAIFEREAGIRFVLASDEQVIFDDANTDPYDESNSRSAMELNQWILDSFVGNANYDIGHLLTTANGGLNGIAYLNSVCNNAFKGMGVSGLAEPNANNSAFYVDIVAHEIAHQFSATHTFNSVQGSCQTNRVAATAYEPGSGGTIMSYSGLCNSDNVQTNSYSRFHLASLNQILDFAYTPGNAAQTCATVLTRSNQQPTVNAGSDYTVPAGTALRLMGTATDPDNDTLGYAWEELDTGVATTVLEDTGNNPLAKVMPLNTLPVRTLPDIPTFLHYGYQPGTLLPATTRSMQFALIARDNKGGAGYDTMKVNVVDTGARFQVLSPSTAQLPSEGDIHLSWNVAATDQAPINCQSVDVAITADGRSFTSLRTRLPNSGEADITLPYSTAEKRYIRVQCSDNIFFALSGVDFPVARANPQADPTPDENDLDTGKTVTTTQSGGAGSLPLWGLGLIAIVSGLCRRQRAHAIRTA